MAKCFIFLDLKQTCSEKESLSDLFSPHWLNDGLQLLGPGPQVCWDEGDELGNAGYEPPASAAGNEDEEAVSIPRCSYLSSKLTEPGWTCHHQRGETEPERNRCKG